MCRMYRLFLLIILSLLVIFHVQFMKVKQITGDILEKICDIKVIKIVEIAYGLYTIKINIPNF